MGNNVCGPELLSEHNTAKHHVHEVTKNSPRKLMRAHKKRTRANIASLAPASLALPGCIFCMLPRVPPHSGVGSSFYGIIVEFLRIKPPLSGKKPTN